MSHCTRRLIVTTKSTSRQIAQIHYGKPVAARRSVSHSRPGVLQQTKVRVLHVNPDLRVIWNRGTFSAVNGETVSGSCPRPPVSAAGLKGIIHEQKGHSCP